MASGTKTFTTQFRIGAIWQGQKGVQQAQRAMGGLQKTAHNTAVRVKGVYKSALGAVTTYGLASKAVSGLTNTLLKSVDAAAEAQEVHDELGLSIERNAKRYKSTYGKSAAEVDKIVRESTETLIALSEQYSKTGHDAENLQAGWTKLLATGAMSPAQVQEQAKAFSDVLSYTAGANATAEESAQLGEQWADGIMRGNLALAKTMDLSDAEIDLLQAVNKAREKGTISAEEGIKRRTALFLKFSGKFKGETERVFSKPAGKLALMQNRVNDIYETLGEPFVARADTMATSFDKVNEAVKPIATELAKIVDEELTELAAWFEKNPDKIASEITKIWSALKSVENVLNAINSAVTFDQSIWEFLQKVGEPARLPQLEGAPPQQANPALQEGEAGRRYREAQEKGEQAAKAAAEAEKAGEKAAAEPLGSGWPMARQAAAAPTPGAPTPAAAQQAANGTAATTAAGGGTSLLQNERARIAQELASDPKLKQLLQASVKAETGDQSAATQQAYMESIMNRAAAESRSLRAVITDPKYYPAATKNKLGRTFSPAEQARMEAMTSEVLGGSNVANFATGNESLNVGNKSRARGIWMPILSKPKGGYERFVGEPHTRDWVERMQREHAATARTTQEAPKTSSLSGVIKGMNLQRPGAAGSQSVAMNGTNITINGVASGRETMMANKVRMALRDPLEHGLAELKRMRAHEARTGYV